MLMTPARRSATAQAVTALVETLARSATDQAANDVPPAIELDGADSDAPAPTGAFDGLVAALTAPSSLPERAAQTTAAADGAADLKPCDEVDDSQADAPDDDEVAEAVELLRNRALSRTLGADRRKTIAERMVQARELNGYPQVEAAGLFGHKNPTQMSLWERGGRVPPLKDLVKAAEVYGVSVDFLMGISPEADRDPRPARRAAAMRAVRVMLEGVAARVVDQVDQINELAGPSAQTVRNLVLKATALADATGAFMRKNARKFADMPAGAPLAHAQQELEPLLTGAREMLRRLDRAERELDARLRGQLAALPGAQANGDTDTAADNEGGTAD